MNKKSRLLLPTIGLLVLSGIAATSTTFAWFTTVRSAQVTFTKAQVTSTDASLSIAHAHSWNSNRDSGAADAGQTLVHSLATDVDGKNTLSYTGTPKVTDISGDGKTFYKPIWAVAGTSASTIPAVTVGSVGDADGKFLDFTIKVSRSNADGAEGLKVYLGVGTAITAVDSGNPKDVKAVEAVRMSVYKSTVAGVLGDKIFVHSPVEESVNNSKYIASAASGTNVYGVDERTVKADLGVKHAAFNTGTTNLAAAANYPTIAELVGWENPDAGERVVDAYLNFRFWIEGEDIDASNSAILGEFKVTLDLYALPHNA